MKEKVNMDIISVDYKIDMEWLIKNLKTDIILQGNIDPNKINRGGKELEDEVKKLVLSTMGRKHIYCSGHGLCEIYSTAGSKKLTPGTFCSEDSSDCVAKCICDKGLSAYFWPNN